MRQSALEKLQKMEAAKYGNINQWKMKQFVDVPTKIDNKWEKPFKNLDNQ